MAERDIFTVTVSRTGEGLHQSPYETRTGHTLTIKPDGSLSIQGANNAGWGLSGGWDSLELQLLPGSKNA
jgi:hypothetical protein